MIKQSNQAKLDEAASSLHVHQEKLMAYLLRQPPLHAVARYLELSLASVEGESLRQQALETAEIFEHIACGLSELSLHEFSGNSTKYIATRGRFHAHLSE